MLRALWTEIPVSSGTYRAFNEPDAYQNNKWFFDKSVWQKLFRTMSSCDFNALVLGNTHPFPFLIDLAQYPEAIVIDDAMLHDYQMMHHWIFETAFDYGLIPYLAFNNIFMPSNLLKARGMEPEEAAVPSDFAVEYTSHCFHTVLETYPEICGYIVDVSGIEGEASAQFVQNAILDTMDATNPEAAIYLRGFEGDPSGLMNKISRRGIRLINYVAPYTHQHLVGAGADSDFTKCVDAAGAEMTIAEFDPCNFEPWTSFSYEAAEEILGDLSRTNCQGFFLHPLSTHEWPFTSDTFFKYQWQRDFPWYSVWGGSSIAKMLSQGQPKWMLRNAKLIPGFSAGSRILELLSLYFAGDRKCGWRPQFCTFQNAQDAQPHLFSIADMLYMQTDSALTNGSWWKEVTGDIAISLEEYLKSGTPEDSYGPDELIEELTDLSQQAIEAGEKGSRSASGEKELPSFARDAFCMGKLGEFYAKRLRAALAHGRGEDAEALENMTQAVAIFEEIQTADSAHREQFTIRADHSAAHGNWSATLDALKAELADASEGMFKKGSEYKLS